MFTKSNLKRLIFPLIVEQLFAVTVGIADTVMISGEGQKAISGISLVNMINVLLIGLFSALATGGSVVAAQYIGQKEKEKVKQASNQLILSVSILALFITAIACILNHNILSLVYGAIDSDIMKHAVMYFYLSAVSYPFIALYNALAALFRANGNSRVTMYVSLVMNLINVIGNAIFIFGMGLGVFGAGLATLLSRMVAAGIILYLLNRSHNMISIRTCLKCRLDFTMIKRIMQIGIPTGLENSIFQFGKILLGRLIAQYGEVGITANTVSGNIVSFACIPGNAIGLAMITIVGQCVGAGNLKQVKKYTLKLLSYTWISMAILNVLIFTAVGPILNIYQLSPETWMLARKLIRYHCIICTIIWPASFALPNALRAASDAKYTMTVSVVSMWVCRISLSYVFAQGLHMGVFGVWVAMTVDWIARAIFFLHRFVFDGWKKKAMMYFPEHKMIH